MDNEAPRLFAQSLTPPNAPPAPCAARGDYRLVMTVLPNGSDSGFHRFSVMISPQLSPACATNLSEFRPLLTDWPAAARAMRFEIAVELNERDQAGRAIVQTYEPQLVSSSKLDSRLWTTVFPEQTFVRPFVFDRREISQPQKTQPVALPERNLYRFAIKEGIFQHLAVTTPTTKPLPADVLPRLDLAGIIHRTTPSPAPGAAAYRVRIDQPVSAVLNIRDKLMKQEMNLLLQIQPRGGTGATRQELLSTVPKLRTFELVQAVTQNQFTDRHLEFFEYQAWFHRTVPPGPPKPPAPAPDELNWARNIDFHQLVSSVSDYPEISQRLGLRLDFQIPDRAIQKPGKVSIHVKDPAIGPHVLSPKTEYTVTRGFRAKADDASGLQEGFLPFGRTETIPVRDVTGRMRSYTVPVFDVVPGDVEGAVGKIANFAEQLLSPDQMKPGATDAVFPALRSAGLAVAHTQRDRWFQTLLLRASQIHDGLKNQDPALVLRMEDLIRGFRIDVREIRRTPNGAPQFGPWRSLCERQAAYSIGPSQPPLVTSTDEGWVALGLTQGQSDAPPVAGAPPIGGNPAQATVPRILRLYESLFRWSGWSLCVPRTGKPVSSGVVATGSAANGLNLQIRLSPVQGSLPRLRFGRQYQFRARLVDLAGNSVPVTDPMLNLANPVVTSDQDGYYDRFEPVNAPVVLLTAPITGNVTAAFPNGEPIAPGESSSRLVIRTINIERRDEVAAGPANNATVRHILPPKVSQELAEAHGMFDNPQTRKVVSTDAYRLMTQKDGSLSNTDSGESVHPESFVVAPYLPDPMAGGAALYQLPGVDKQSGGVFLQPFDGPWPERRSFRFQVEAGQASPQFQNGILRVFVPPGEQRTVQLSSFFPANGENLFGIWRWIQEKLRDGQAGANIESLRTLVRQGRHWMLSPARELVLVHATQQPWLTPLWVFLDCARQTAGSAAPVERQRRIGETTAPLLGTVALHRPSTEKFSLQADWRDPVDQGPMQENLNAWLYITGSEPVFEQPVAPPLDPGKPQILSRGLSEMPQAAGEIPELPRDSFEIERFPDDRLPDRIEEPQPSAEPQSRAAPGPQSAQQLRDLLLKQPPAQQPAPRVEAIIPYASGALSSNVTPYDESKYRCAKPPADLAPPNYGERIAFSGSHRLHDTKYRCVTYSMTATTRYRDYFRPLKNENAQNMPRFTRTSPPIQVDILNSAQPDAPKVLYVLPTFKWESTPQGRRRIGGGLRVYLDRPWFSSGDGEQLAVVLYPDATADLPDYAVPVVTQWGLDPLWEPGPSRLPPGVLEKLEPGKVPQLEMPPKIAPPSPPSPAPLVPFQQLKPGLQQLTPRGIEQGDEVTSRATPLDLSLKSQLINRFGVGLSHPTPAHFSNAVAVRQGLAIEEVRLPSSTIQTRGLEQAAMTLHLRDALLTAAAKWSPPLPVTICAFDVKPDPARQLWYCDIEMDPGTAYFPFVRLALARYQVNSVPRAHLSPVVLADFAQLVPDRSCSLVRAQDPKDPNAVIVSIAGTTGSVSQERSTQVEISLEERTPNLPEDLGWAAVPNTTVILNHVDQQQWQGKISLPAAAAAKVFRIVIREYEIFRGTEADTGRSEERRLVFADALPLLP